MEFKTSGKQDVYHHGLYNLKRNEATEYYWHLAGEAGTNSVWVKDTETSLLADQPFALPSEITEQNQDIQRAVLLANSIVWVNRNQINSGDVTGKIANIEQLTVIEFRSVWQSLEK